MSRKTFKQHPIVVRAKEEGYQDGYDDGIEACLDFKHSDKDKKSLVWCTKTLSNGRPIKFVVDPVLAGIAFQALSFLVASKFDPVKMARADIRQKLIQGAQYLKLIVDSGQHKRLINDAVDTMEAVLHNPDLINENAVAKKITEIDREWNSFEDSTKNKLTGLLQHVTGAATGLAHRLMDIL